MPAVPRFEHTKPPMVYNKLIRMVMVHLNMKLSFACWMPESISFAS